MDSRGLNSSGKTGSSLCLCVRKEVGVNVGCREGEGFWDLWDGAWCRRAAVQMGKGTRGVSVVLW